MISQSQHGMCRSSKTPHYCGNVNQDPFLPAGQVFSADFDQAILRAVAGIEKKRSILVGVEKSVVAKHEAGHALVSTAVQLLIPTSAAVEKLSIIPRTGGALGCDGFLPYSCPCQQATCQLSLTYAVKKCLKPPRATHSLASLHRTVYGCACFLVGKESLERSKWQELMVLQVHLCPTKDRGQSAHV